MLAFKSSLAMAFEKVVRQVSNLFVFFAVAALYPTDEFGLLVYNLSVLSIIAAISLWGANLNVSNDVPQFPTQIVEIMVSAITTSVATAIIVSTIIYLCLANNIAQSISITWLILIIFFVSYHSFESYYSTVNKSSVYSSISVIVGLFCVCLKVYGIYYQWEIKFFLNVLLLDYALLTLISGFVFFSTHKFRIDFNSTLKKVKVYYWSGLFFTMSSLSVILNLRVDQVMLGSFSKLEDLANYALVSKIFEGIIMLMAVIIQNYFPRILKYNQTKKYIYDRGITYITRDLLILALALMLVLFISLPLIRYVFGAFDPIFITLFMLYIPLLLIMTFGLITPRVLVAANLKLVYFSIQFLSALLNILLNFVLIENFGAFGALFSTFISYSFASIIGLLLYASTRNLFLIYLKSFTLIPTRLKNIFLTMYVRLQ